MFLAFAFSVLFSQAVIVGDAEQSGADTPITDLFPVVQYQYPEEK